MKLTIIEIKEIIRVGGGMNIDATSFTIINLKDFARLAERSGAIITIFNVENLTVLNLKDIARLGAGKVIFQFYR